MDERYDEKNQGTWANNGQMPDILKDGNILAKESEKKEHAEILGKWLWILFWLIIPSAIAGILGNENLFGKESGLQTSSSSGLLGSEPSIRIRGFGYQR